MTKLLEKIKTHKLLTATMAIAVGVCTFGTVSLVNAANESNTKTLTVNKVWDDDNNASGARPDSVKITMEISGDDEASSSDFYYAVSVYGIGQDVDENGKTMGLTFGPATGC